MNKCKWPFQCSNSFVTNLVSLLFYFEQNDKLFDLCDSKCLSLHIHKFRDSEIQTLRHSETYEDVPSKCHKIENHILFYVFFLFFYTFWESLLCFCFCWCPLPVTCSNVRMFCSFQIHSFLFIFVNISFANDPNKGFINSVYHLTVQRFTYAFCLCPINFMYFLESFIMKFKIKNIKIDFNDNQ